MHIEGLKYIEDYISEQEETALIHQIDQEVWLDDLKRRVQHYGYKYDYKKRNIDASMKIGNLPFWAESLATNLKEQGYMPYLPDQLIVNEYFPGQGIAAHIDCEPCFDDTIISLSLGSHCTMEFTHKDKSQHLTLILNRRSLLVMSGEARYEWLHGIKGKQSDLVNEVKTYRDRRISLTFRKIK
jgi:alkylated DNA repair dioxygenase AlkB